MDFITCVLIIRIMIRNAVRSTREIFVEKIWLGNPKLYRRVLMFSRRRYDDDCGNVEPVSLFCVRILVWISF